MRLNIIVAIASNGGIGLNGKLPWRIKEDMQFFTQITKTDGDKKNAVIMGKNTWLSIPLKFRPLRGRLNVVISNTLKEVPECVMICENLSSCLDYLEGLCAKGEVDDVFVIGGSRLYEEAITQKRLPVRIYCTHVLEHVECDVKFPLIDWNDFTEISLSTVPTETKTEGSHTFRFAVYDQKAPCA